MRKGFSFLLGIFVCALLTNDAVAQSQAINPETQSEQFAVTVISLPPDAASANATRLSSSQASQRIAEARELLKSQVAKTISADVTLAALDSETSEINLFSVARKPFLTKGANVLAKTQLGHTVQLHVISANGVNTAVTVSDASTGRSFIPLVVQYPIIKSGTLTEIAYYTSAHPALLSANIMTAGKSYVTTMLGQAAKNLAADGVTISPDIINVAEHLVIVEHTDHQRFLNEDRSEIYSQVLSLYALNQGDTFKYAVSSAGAGGMIQMMPRTYANIRDQHAGVQLESDFVSGMSNHANALKVMLLYINDTWRYLEKHSEVQDALRNGTATKSELLAAGYNSNPMRLPTYLKNGGAGWRSLIPAETQMYLAIYGSLDSAVKFDQSYAEKAVAAPAATQPAAAVNESGRVASRATSWLGGKLLMSESLFSFLTIVS